MTPEEAQAPQTGPMPHYPCRLCGRERPTTETWHAPGPDVRSVHVCRDCASSRLARELLEAIGATPPGQPESAEWFGMDRAGRPN